MSCPSFACRSRLCLAHTRPQICRGTIHRAHLCIEPMATTCPGRFAQLDVYMSVRIWLKLAEVLVPVLLVITIFVAWQADRRDRAQLATQLAAAQQTIAQATANQHDRDSALNQTLAQIAAQKQSTLTPAQLLQALPLALSLPQPLTQQPGNQANVGARFIAPSADASSTNPQQNAKTQTIAAQSTLPNNPTPKLAQSGDAILPAADLKPLYDFALDCKACQTKLAASQADLADEKTKSAALTKQRDAAVHAAKGGSALRRIARASKWFAIGAAAGAIAAKATR
jgi:cobalamin biosynthesis Mg chelatase CobN